ncbi:hypothetical protein TELCIR_26340, partial [Teladorsagia circumcincta]
CIRGASSKIWYTSQKCLQDASRRVAVSILYGQLLLLQRFLTSVSEDGGTHEDATARMWIFDRETGNSSFRWIAVHIFSCTHADELVQ